MNKVLCGGVLGLAGLLTSCAPSAISSSGRIINTLSGQEGRVVFVGGFYARPAVPGAPDNVTVQLGQDLYSGSYSVIGENNLGLSAQLGWGNGWGWGPRSFWSSDLSYAPRNTVQPGNLVVKTATARSKTLSCNFQADQRGHGVGDCQGSDGAKYTLQF